MSMYFFTFLAVPTPEADEYSEAGGAYVNCWIPDDDRQHAEERARGLIHEYGWSVETLEEGGTVTSDDYSEEDEDREFYEQALAEGEVLVFNTWPPGGDEEGEEDEEDEDEDEETA